MRLESYSCMNGSPCGPEVLMITPDRLSSDSFIQSASPVRESEWRCVSPQPMTRAIDGMSSGSYGSVPQPESAAMTALCSSLIWTLPLLFGSHAKHATDGRFPSAMSTQVMTLASDTDPDWSQSPTQGTIDAGVEVGVGVSAFANAGKASVATIGTMTRFFTTPPMPTSLWRLQRPRAIAS